jgi:hypothetical protein
MAAEIHQEGLTYMLNVSFRATAQAANTYIGLCTDASLAENATLASLTEVAGTGYARIAVATDDTDFPTSQTTGTNDWQVVTKQVTFTGGAGGWTGAVTAFLCTAASGTSGSLIASAQLWSTRTLASGDTLKITFTITLAG